MYAQPPTISVLGRNGSREYFLKQKTAKNAKNATPKINANVFSIILFLSFRIVFYKCFSPVITSEEAKIISRKLGLSIKSVFDSD